MAQGAAADGNTNRLKQDAAPKGPLPAIRLVVMLVIVQEALDGAFDVPDQQRPFLLFQMHEQFIKVGVLLQALQF